MGKGRQKGFAAALVLGCCLAGCSGGADASSAAEPADPPAAVQGQEQPKRQEEAPSVSHQEADPGVNEQTLPEKPQEKSQEVDMDLTGFSQNMLYAEVCNMGLFPSDYTGKVIRLTGEFAHFPALDENQQPVADEDILVCMVTDTMACCAAGVEFLPEDGSDFSEPYPEEGSLITVTGVCQITVDEGGFLVIVRLHDAHVELAA